MSMTLSSEAFEPNKRIPTQYTGDGQNQPPPLKWSGAPEGTESFALICDDSDARMDMPFVHWVVWDIPAHTRSLIGAGVGTEGVNSFGDVGYGGPAPPPGHDVHHYHFKLHALDTTLGLGTGATKEHVLDAMHSHVLDEAELIGTYQR